MTTSEPRPRGSTLVGFGLGTVFGFLRPDRLPGQRVVSGGPYAVVRHPLYVAAFLIWLALALAFASPVALAFTVLYVIPGYVIYIRSEEEMLVAHLGDAYGRYQRDVGRLCPRLRQLSRPAHPPAARG